MLQTFKICLSFKILVNSWGNWSLTWQRRINQQFPEMLVICNKATFFLFLSRVVHSQSNPNNFTWKETRADTTWKPCYVSAYIMLTYILYSTILPDFIADFPSFLKHFTGIFDNLYQTNIRMFNALLYFCPHACYVTLLICGSLTLNTNISRTAGLARYRNVSRTVM